MALDQSGDGGSHGTSPGRNDFTWRACRQSRVRRRRTARRAIGSARATARRAGRRAAAAWTATPPSHDRAGRRDRTTRIVSGTCGVRTTTGAASTLHGRPKFKDNSGTAGVTTRDGLTTAALSSRWLRIANRHRAAVTSGLESLRSRRTGLHVFGPGSGSAGFDGSSGAYPYGYTPRGYFDPIPGRAYGGLRITELARGPGVRRRLLRRDRGRLRWRVPALESGGGSSPDRGSAAGDADAVEFDVFIQPGRTITFRADW